MTHGIGQLKPPATSQVASPPVSLAPKVEPQPEDTVSKWQTPPGFAEIARSLHRDRPSWVVEGVPPELTEEQDPIRMVGSKMFSTWLLQDSMSGATYIDMVTCSMSLVGLGVTLSVVNYSMPTLQGQGDLDSN